MAKTKNVNEAHSGVIHGFSLCLLTIEGEIDELEDEIIIHREELEERKKLLKKIYEYLEEDMKNCS